MAGAKGKVSCHAPFPSCTPAHAICSPHGGLHARCCQPHVTDGETEAQGGSPNPQGPRAHSRAPGLPTSGRGLSLTAHTLLCMPSATHSNCRKRSPKLGSQAKDFCMSCQYPAGLQGRAGHPEGCGTRASLGHSPLTSIVSVAASQQRSRTEWLLQGPDGPPRREYLLSALSRRGLLSSDPLTLASGSSLAQ